MVEVKMYIINIYIILPNQYNTKYIVIIINHRLFCFQELNFIEDGKIYKLIGPVLVEQDPAEAKDTVTKRIEYISKEM